MESVIIVSDSCVDEEEMKEAPPNCLGTVSELVQQHIERSVVDSEVQQPVGLPLSIEGSDLLDESQLQELKFKVFELVKSGDLTKLQALAETYSNYNIDYNQFTDESCYDQTAIFSVISVKNPDVQLSLARFLVDSLHLDPNYLDSNSQTVLYYAARDGCYLLAAYLIIDCHSDVNHRDRICG